MKDNIVVVAVVGFVSSIITLIGTKIVDRFVNKKISNYDDLNQFIIKTNNFKDVYAHLDDAKERRLILDQEREQIKDVIKQFPLLLEQIKAISQSVEHLEKTLSSKRESSYELIKAVIESMNKKMDKLIENGGKS